MGSSSPAGAGHAEMAAKVEQAHLLLPDNWHIDGPEVTDRGSVYMSFVGRIEGAYSPRDPSIIVCRPHGASEWRATPAGDYIDADGKVLARGGPGLVIARAIRLAAEQNARWAAIDGFNIPGERS